MSYEIRMREGSLRKDLGEGMSVTTDDLFEESCYLAREAYKIVCLLDRFIKREGILSKLNIELNNCCYNKIFGCLVDVIAESPEYSLLFAKNIVCGRFRDGELEIMKYKLLWEEYLEFLKSINHEDYSDLIFD